MEKSVTFLTLPLVRRVAISALGLLAMVLVYTGVWVYGARVMIEASQHWVGERRAEGYSVRYDDMRATGYPFWIRVELANPGFGAPHATSPWDWEGDSLNVTARPWRPGRFFLRTSGQQMVSFLGGEKRQTYRGTLDGAQAELIFKDGDPQSVDLRVLGLDLAAQQGTTGGKISLASADINVRRLPVATGAGQGAATLTLDLTSSGIELPTTVIASPLGSKIEGLRMTGRLLGSLPRGPGASLIEALEIWRDGGGTVEVDRIALSHGALGIRADGTLALDRDLQPVGAFTARVQGFNETLDAFSHLGIIGAGQAMSAKLLLGVFAKRPRNGGPATLNVALTVQQRNFYAGPVKLLQLPLVRW